MDKTEIKEELYQQLKKLDEKYDAMGQDLSSYLDGLLYSDYLTYWDYIHLDTLLSLQNPRTSFPDEKIFIAYHQITELFFKLILMEIEQIPGEEGNTEKFIMRIDRINRYFQQLVNSFEIMIDGMEKEQFLKFRMSLLPSSGFQSVQYRMIEICSTDLRNLMNVSYREKIDPDGSEDVLYDYLYWKSGATELATGKKTLTLNQFDEKYSEQLKNLAKKFRETNIWQVYQKYHSSNDLTDQAIKSMRELDSVANLFWPLAHFKSAVRYLHRDPNVISATGGTNWQKFLPPKFQKVIFFPDIWTEEERNDWGKGWVMKEILNEK